MKIPCEECISLAICRHKKHINCIRLWKTFWRTNDNTSHMGIFDGLAKILPTVFSVEMDGFGIVVNKQHPYYTFKEGSTK